MNAGNRNVRYDSFAPPPLKPEIIQKNRCVCPAIICENRAKIYD